MAFCHFVDSRGCKVSIVFSEEFGGFVGSLTLQAIVFPSQLVSSSRSVLIRSGVREDVQ